MSKLIDELIEFLDSSPTAWHAVDVASEKLQKAGFSLLDEKEAWNLVPGGRYQVIRNGAAMAAHEIVVPALKLSSNPLKEPVPDQIAEAWEAA